MQVNWDDSSAKIALAGLMALVNVECLFLVFHLNNRFTSSGYNVTNLSIIAEWQASICTFLILTIIFTKKGRRCISCLTLLNCLSAIAACAGATPFML